MVRTRKMTSMVGTSVDDDASTSLVERPAKRQKREQLAEVVAASPESPVEGAVESSPSLTQSKRRTKSKPKDFDSGTFLARADSSWKVGAHVSSAGGVENAVLNAISIGANAFALFLKSQRKWESPPLSSGSIDEFKKRMKEYGYSSRLVLPHGSYLINLANPDVDKREKSYTCFLDDLKRCEDLGLELYNFHPGSTVGATAVENALTTIAECINRAHKETENVTIVLENMAGANNIIGSDFDHLAGIISQVEDKKRVGVCLDTCHAFAAGFDIRTKEGWNSMMTEFDEKIGLSYLCGMHLNDSKTEYNSKRDRHENIGMGFLGIQAFKHLLNDERVQNIPLILETPSFEQPKEVWGKEIEILQKISETTTGVVDDGVLDGLVEEVRVAVKDAEAVKPKAKKVAKVKQSSKKRRTKKDEEDTEDDDDCDD